MLFYIMDGLFYIRKADGLIHKTKLAFWERVAYLLKIAQHRFNQLKAMHVLEESHPERMIARGVSEKFLKIAHARLLPINNAWEHIANERNVSEDFQRGLQFGKPSWI